jgi:putative methionine-R-sulfoxide reductase with GAF domain
MLRILLSKLIACNSGDPAFLTFPKEQGLNGRAVKNKKVVVVNDVSQDPRYLTTFGKTQSEIIIRIISRTTNEVIGTIDVESHFKNAFGDNDIEVLTKCATEIDRCGI